MNGGKKKDFKNTTSEFTLNTALEVGAEYSAETFKSSGEEVLGDLTVDIGASMMPSLAGAAQNYKRRRFENNISFVKIS